MKIRKLNYLTAILLMAVMFICLNGCIATTRHIDEIKVELRELKAQNDETKQIVAGMEEVINEGAEASKKLRNDVSVSTDQLQERIDMLLENYNELINIIRQLNSNMGTKHIIQSSPGSQADTDRSSTEKTVEEDNSTSEQKPSINCVDAYDEAFILLTRQEKYEEAIVAFNKFLSECPDHESVENAHYWVGESFYSLDKFVEASEKFQYLLDNYKSSVNLSRAIYKLARCNQELGKNDVAKKLYQQLIDDYPDTFEANQAKERIKDF